MEKLQFDDGVKEFEVNGRELLRFNPSDPNVYNRFYEAARELPDLEREYAAAEGEDTENGEQALRLMREVDVRVKERLSHVFGAENDFDRILGGVNLMAVGRNGERVVTNFFAALAPVMEEGAAQHRKDTAKKAVAEARENRAQRRAVK